MSKKVWYEIYAYGQIRESEKTLLAKIKGYSNALQIKKSFEDIGYKEVEIK